MAEFFTTNNEATTEVAKWTATILVKILGTRHKIELFQSLIQCPPLPPFQCWLNQTPFDHPNIELGGKGDEKVLNVCFHLDILGNMTKTQKFASVPIYFTRIVVQCFRNSDMHNRDRE